MPCCETYTMLLHLFPCHQTLASLLPNSNNNVPKDVQRQSSLCILHSSPQKPLTIHCRSRRKQISYWGTWRKNVFVSRGREQYLGLLRAGQFQQTGIQLLPSMSLQKRSDKIQPSRALSLCSK